MMNTISRFFSIGALVFWAAGGVAAQEAVSLSRQDQKGVSVAAYWPKGAACRGVAVISPGAGGSEKGYQYLGVAMSSLGYLAVVVGHPESGRRVLREHVRGHGLREGLSVLITDPNAYRGRLMDIAAARQWAATQCLATESVLMGHSMGAATTMMEAGARNTLGMKGADSFGVYIALSPQGSRSIFPQNAWADIKRPVLLLTGTRDDPLGGASKQRSAGDDGVGRDGELRPQPVATRLMRWATASSSFSRYRPACSSSAPAGVSCARRERRSNSSTSSASSIWRTR